MRKLLATGMLSALISAPAIANGQYRVDFDGDFDSVTYSNELCETVFSTTEYVTKHFLVGPTHRTIVTYFENAEEAGLFHGVRFMSNFGYNNDFIYDETLQQDEVEYQVHAEGFVDLKVVYIEVDVVAVADDEELCTASGVYSGFN